MHSVDILLHNTHLRNFRLAELLPETAAREQLRWAVGIESPQYQGVFFFRTLYKAPRWRTKPSFEERLWRKFSIGRREQLCDFAYRGF